MRHKIEWSNVFSRWMTYKGKLVDLEGKLSVVVVIVLGALLQIAQQSEKQVTTKDKRTDTQLKHVERRVQLLDGKNNSMSYFRTYRTSLIKNKRERERSA